MSFRGSQANVPPSLLEVYFTSRLSELLDRQVHSFSTTFTSICSDRRFSDCIVIIVTVDSVFAGTILRETLQCAAELLGDSSEMFVTIRLRVIVSDTSHPLVLLLLPLKH